MHVSFHHFPCFFSMFLKCSLSQVVKVYLSIHVFFCNLVILLSSFLITFDVDGDTISLLMVKAFLIVVCGNALFYFC